MVHNSEEKYFNKSQNIDTYAIILSNDKITMLLRQSGDLHDIKFLKGYGVSVGNNFKHYSFC